MLEFVDENETKTIYDPGMLSFDVSFKTKTTLKVEKAKEIVYKKRIDRMFEDEWSESVRCFIEDLMITKALRFQMLILRLPNLQKEGGTSYKSIPNAFKLVDKGLDKNTFYAMILLINLSKNDVGVNYEEIIDFTNIDGFNIMGLKPGTATIKIDMGIDQHHLVLLRKTKIKTNMAPE